MPFTAQCPNCRSARFRVPWKKHQQSMACPKCSHSFSLVPDDEPPAPSRNREPSLVAEVTKPEVRPAREFVEQEGVRVHFFDLPLAVALGALVVFGVAVLLGQIPYGRFAAVALAPFGVLAAGFSLFALEKRRWLAWVGIVANGSVFLLMLIAPTWLGVSTWIPPTDPNEGMNGVLSVGKDGSPPVPAESVDANVAAWQQRDVRMEIVSVRIGPLDPAAKTPEKRKQRVLRIAVLVSNVGVARGIECGSTTDLPTEFRLATITGQVVPWNKVESPIKPITLYPGKSAEVGLVFDVPPEPLGDLQFELPTGLMGNKDAVKFRIPLAMIARR